MDYLILVLIAIGGGMLGALLAELTILRALRSWQGRRDAAAYLEKHKGKFVPNDWDNVGWIDEGIPAPTEALWTRLPFTANEPLYVRDPLPTLADIRRVLDDLHERGEPIPGEIVLSRAQWDYLTKHASPTAMGPVGLDSMALALFGIPVRFVDTNPGQRPFDIIEARQRLDEQVRDMLNDIPERAKICTCVVELDNRKIQKLALDCPIHTLTENPDQEGLR